MPDVKPQSCPRYERCSANICAFDRDWRKRSHVRSDAICFYLTEAVKPNAVENFALLAQEWVLEAVRPLATDDALPDAIKTALERARSTGSKIINQRAAGERLKKVV